MTYYTPRLENTERGDGECVHPAAASVPVENLSHYRSVHLPALPLIKSQRGFISPTYTGYSGFYTEQCQSKQ